MVVSNQPRWSALPRLADQSPVLSLLSTSDGLWAGGFGAVACRKRDGWILAAPPLSIGAVLALAEGGSTVFAAGTGGVVRSTDRGAVWSPGRGTQPYTVLCLAPSPAYGDDEVILAGTAEAGILRSADGGITWTAAQFGMQGDEVTGLVWTDDSAVLATTAEGLYRSTNSGRSWRLLASHAFSTICYHEDRLLAADTEGAIWQSVDAGESWAVLGALPEGVEPQAIAVLPQGSVLVGSVGHGVFSTVDGTTWNPWSDHQVLSFLSDGQTVYAGTSTGVVAFEALDREWQQFGSPPLHDCSRVLALDEAIFVSGALSSPRRWTTAEGWVVLDTCPSPTRVFIAGWDGELLAATLEGLFASSDLGETWQQRSSVAGGDFLTVRTDGMGWMAAADASRLVVTSDRGHTWTPLSPPFGVFPVLALQAPQQAGDAPLLAVTYDIARQSANLWQSGDDGMHWKRGNEAITVWPVVSTLSDPLAISIGEAVILRGPDGIWMRTRPGGGAVRQLAASNAGLAALTQEGIWLKTANDRTWQAVAAPTGVVKALTLDGNSLVVLMTDGEVLTQMVGPR